MGGESLRDYDNERLREWQEKYEQARSAYADSLDAFKGYAKRYDGAHDQGPGKPVSVVWNITKSDETRLTARYHLLKRPHRSIHWQSDRI